ncbi:restriction endonuclease subunit S [Helicobacter sp. 11S03491-1]|uniref:restriction endonuclease subunit S n=1 Tax=Helicobacter sp. 11S03491-1 TaxID=1476196 RepID=UPI000BA7CBBE|nr:restriction endonuclease subunit S [Helicobacter sp. 11S03491-1]
MAGFKRYAEYKKTNIKWIREILQHWEYLPNRAIFKERKTRNKVNEELLSVTIKKGIIKQTALLENSSKKDSSNEDKSKYKLVKMGDIVYNKMRMWQGAVGFSEYQGIVSPAYIILSPYKKICSKFFHYIFRSPNYIKYSYNNSYGICDDQLSLRFEDFNTMYSICPPIAEQQQIATFIEHKEEQINKLIRRQKRLIELL